MGKGVPEKAKLRKRGPQLFFLISTRFQIGTHFKQLWWCITIPFVSHGLLSSHLHPDLRSQVLHRCADLCLKSSLVNRNLRLVKIKVGCASSKGLSAILEHRRTFIKCILAGLERNSGKNSWADSSLAPWLGGDYQGEGMRSGSCSHCTDRRESTNRRISYSSFLSSWIWTPL